MDHYLVSIAVSWIYSSINLNCKVTASIHPSTQVSDKPVYWFTNEASHQ